MRLDFTNCAFESIDYQEKINYLKGFEVNEKTIKKALIDYSLKK